MLKTTLKPMFDAALYHSPLQPLFRHKTNYQVVVLAYHGIDDPECFEQHLFYLTEYLHPISLQELLAAFDGRYPLPKSSVLLTFDDGYRSVLEKAMPIMRDLGVPGIAFVVPGLLNSSTPLWTDEVKDLAKTGAKLPTLAQLSPDALVQKFKTMEDQRRLEAIAELREIAQRAASAVPQLQSTELRVLEANGIAVGNHTMTHPCLPRCSDTKIRQELTQSHDALTEILGHAPSAFAYPNGDADDRVAKVLAELDYRVGFLFDHRLNPKMPPNPYRISRLRVNSDTSLDRFRIIVSGLHPTLHRLRSGK